MTKQQKSQRTITVLVRYYIKATGSVVLYVENGAGKRYYITLNRNKQHHCSCASFKRCYHIDRAVELENARYEAAKLAKASKVVEMPTQEVVSSPVATTEYTMSPALHAKLASMNEVQPVVVEESVEKPEKVLEMRGTLNGAQQSASFFSNLPSRQKIAS